MNILAKVLVEFTRVLGLHAANKQGESNGESPEYSETTETIELGEAMEKATSIRLDDVPVGVPGFGEVHIYLPRKDPHPDVIVPSSQLIDLTHNIHTIKDICGREHRISLVVRRYLRRSDIE